MNKKFMVSREKKEFVGCIFLVIFVYGILLSNHIYLNGDEVNTYSTSNSEFDGWMFSEGKTAIYLRNEIWDQNPVVFIANVTSAIKDVMTHGKNAFVFTSEQPEEEMWYTGQSVIEWLSAGEASRFNYLSVFYNSLIDGFNPPGYFYLIHTISSFFTNYFSTWFALCINLFFLVGTLCVLYRIARIYCFTHVESILYLLAYAGSLGCLREINFIRAYGMMTFFGTCLFYLQLRILQSKRKSDEIQKLVRLMMGVYILGFISQYFMAVIFASSSSMLFLCLLKERDWANIKYLIKSCVPRMGLAVVLGVLLAPGVLVSFIKDSDSSQRGTITLASLWTIFTKMMEEILVNEYIGVIVLLALFVTYMFLFEISQNVQSKWILLIGTVVLYCVVVLMVIQNGGRYFWTIYPYIILLIFKLLHKTLSKVCKNYLRVICIMVIIYFAINFFTEYRETRINCQMGDQVEKSICNYSDKTIIFLREYGGGYSFIPYMENVENWKCIEADFASISEDLDDERILAEDEVYVFDTTNGEYLDIIAEYFNTHGYLIEENICYKSGSSMICYQKNR